MITCRTANSTNTSTSFSNMGGTADDVYEWDDQEENKAISSRDPNCIEELEEAPKDRPIFKRVKKISNHKNRVASINNPAGGWFFFKR